jgi:chromosome segregation ATPase
MIRLHPLPLLAALLATAGFLSAQEPAPAEARLRETLRATLIQLRAAQNDLAAAQNTRDALTEEKNTLSTEIDGLKKQIVADRVASDRALAALKTAAEAQAAELAATQTDLGKTRASLAKVVDYARKADTERADLKARVASLETQVEDHRGRNIALYKLGNEILDRYAKFGLGEAITAREPFTGLTRVKLENQVQDYGDLLAAQRIKSPPVATP